MCERDIYGGGKIYFIIIRFFFNNFSGFYACNFIVIDRKIIFNVFLRI